MYCFCSNINIDTIHSWLNWPIDFHLLFSNRHFSLLHLVADPSEAFTQTWVSSSNWVTLTSNCRKKVSFVQSQRCIPPVTSSALDSTTRWSTTTTPASTPGSAPASCRPDHSQGSTVPHSPEQSLGLASVPGQRSGMKCQWSVTGLLVCPQSGASLQWETSPCTTLPQYMCMAQGPLTFPTVTSIRRSCTGPPLWRTRLEPSEASTMRLDRCPSQTTAPLPTTGTCPHQHTTAGAQHASGNNRERQITFWYRWRNALER